MASEAARKVGKRVTLPGQGSGRQSVVSDVGTGDFTCTYLLVPPVGLVCAGPGWAEFRPDWETVLGIDWFLVGQRTVPAFGHCEVDPTLVWGTKVVRGLSGPAGYGRS